MKIRPHAFAVAVCATLALPAHAQQAAGTARAAQTQPDNGQAKSLATIVVTARKRVELMQDVPIAISVVTSRDIQTAGVTSAADIASLVPGFVMVPLFGSSGYNPVIRGLSTTIGEPNVGFFIDGVYMPSRAALDFLLGDNIERVEVARGPQYALYGRNSFAGAINFITKHPSDTQQGSITLGVGNDGGRDARMVLSGPFKKDAPYYYRVGVLAHDFGGFYRNNLTGGKLDWSHTRGGFLTLSGNPTDRLNGEFNLIYERVRDGDFPERFVPNNGGFSPHFNDYQQFYGNVPSLTNGFAVTPGHFNRDNLITSFALHYDMDFAEFTSVTAYNRLKLNQLYDSDYSATPIAQAGTTGPQTETSQEFRLTSEGDNRIDWLLGLYLYNYDYSHNDSSLYIGPATPLGGLLSDNQEHTRSGAVFGQATWHITRQWDLGLAMRYTSETKSVDATQINLPSATAPAGSTQLFSASRTFRPFTPGLYLTYKATPSTTLYASAVKAIKAGGFNATTTNGAIAPDERYYGPERSMNYEVGAKFSLLDGRMFLDTDAYLIKWRDQIVRSIGQYGAVLNTNAGATTSKGVEANLEIRPFPEWTVKAGASYNVAKYDQYNFALVGLLGGNPNLAGVELQYAPHYTANLSLINTHPLGNGWSWFTRADAFYRSSMVAIQTGTALIPGATRVNLHTGLRTHNLEITFWMDNVFNNKAAASAVFLTDPATVFQFATHQRPGLQLFQPLVYAPYLRTYGVSVRYSF